MVIMVRSLGWKKLCRVDQKIEFFGHLGMGYMEVLFAGSVVHRPVIVFFLQT